MTPDDKDIIGIAQDFKKAASSCRGKTFIWKAEEAETLADALLSTTQKLQIAREALEEISKHEIPFTYDHPEKWCNEFIGIAKQALSRLSE